MYVKPKWKALAISLFLCINFFPTSSFSQETKNVLLVLSDDFNFWVNAIGYYPGVKTPNLDKLASKGILFTQAYSSSAECNPSRNAMMSGFRPSSTGIKKNSDGYFRNVPEFRNAVSLNQYFKEQGYYVYGGGKIYHPARMGGEFTDAENWTDLYTGGVGSPGGDLYKWSSVEKSNLDWSAGEFDIETQAADTKLARHMAGFVKNYPRSSNGQAFFVAMGLFRPHLAWDVHKKFWDLYDREDLVIPPGYKEDDLDDHATSATPVHDEIIEQNKWMEGVHAYLACLSYADFNVGIILDALENSIHKDNTIVVFAGDHGWHLGEKKRWGKSTNYDQASRTTFIIYDPSADGNGRVCHKPVSLQDIYPTLVELAGLEPKTDMEGVSLAPLLSNPTDPNWEVPAYMTYINTDMIRSQTYRLINHGGSPQLYKMDTDPYEWDNLINRPAFRNTREELRGEIAHWKQIGLDLKDKLNRGYKFQPQLNTLPGRIEAENYDEGAINQTYFDRDSENKGGRYREDGVDIYRGDQSTGNGYIGDTQEGEWLQYSLYNTPSGGYRIQARVAITANRPDQGLELYLGTQKVGTINISGESQGWKTISSGRVSLNTRNSRLLRILIKGGGFSIDRLDVEFAETGNQCFSLEQQYQPGELDRRVALNEECQIVVPDLRSEINPETFCGSVQLRQLPVAGTYLSLIPNQKDTILLSAEDGNVTSTYEVVLTAQDTFPPRPVADQLPDRVGQCQVTLTPPEALGNCEQVIRAQTEDPLLYTEPGTYTITWTYKGDNGYSVEQKQNVQVFAPIPWECPDDLILTCNTIDIRPALNSHIQTFFQGTSNQGEEVLYNFDEGLLSCTQLIPIQVFAGEACAEQGLSSCEFSLSLSGNEDTERPTQPGIIGIQSITDTGAIAVWAPSFDNSGVAYYAVSLYLGDSLIANDTTLFSELELGALEPGIAYRIEVKAVDYEGNVSEVRGVTFSTLLTPVITQSREELLKSWITHIYPNPFNHRLTLIPTGELCCPYSLKMYDLMGRELYYSHENVLRSPLHIEGENWPEGVYFLHLQKENQQAILKIVKE